MSSMPVLVTLYMFYEAKALLMPVPQNFTAMFNASRVILMRVPLGLQVRLSQADDTLGEC
jgi:hypothetical protein